MLRPVLGIWQRDLERALLRKGARALRDDATRCADCGRTPLIGERVHRFAGGEPVCELCRPGRGGEPIRVERVRQAEHGHTVRRRTPAP
jgi:hypothetical protein